MTSACWPHQASGCCQQEWRIIPALRQLLHYKSWARGEGHVPMTCPCALPKEVILNKVFLRRNIGSYDRNVASNSMQTTTTNRVKKQNKASRCFLEGKYLGHFFWEGDHKSLYAKYGCWVLDIQRWQRCKTLVPDFKEIMVY